MAIRTLRNPLSNRFLDPNPLQKMQKPNFRSTTILCSSQWTDVLFQKMLQKMLENLLPISDRRLLATQWIPPAAVVPARKIPRQTSKTINHPFERILSCHRVRVFESTKEFLIGPFLRNKQRSNIYTKNTPRWPKRPLVTTKAATDQAIRILLHYKSTKRKQ